MWTIDWVNYYTIDSWTDGVSYGYSHTLFKPHLLRFVWTLFFFFTLLHLYSNYKAVSVVSMETLNCNRLHLLMRNLFLNGTISEPSIINREEPLLLSKLLIVF